MSYEDFRDRAQSVARYISTDSGSPWELIATSWSEGMAKFRRTDGVPSGIFELSGNDLSDDLSRPDWLVHARKKFSAWSMELIEAVDEERDDAHAPVAFDDATAAVEAAVKAERDRGEIIRQRERERVNIGLVAEMLAGAGFELRFNTIESGGYALWEQILPERTNVKVQLALSAEELQLPPASVYRLVFDQVGAK